MNLLPSKSDHGNIFIQKKSILLPYKTTQNVQETVLMELLRQLVAPEKVLAIFVNQPKTMLQRRAIYVSNVEFRELSNEPFRSTIRPLEPLQLEIAEKLSCLGSFTCPVWGTLTVQFGVFYLSCLGNITCPLWGFLPVHFGEHYLSTLGTTYAASCS